MLLPNNHILIENSFFQEPWNLENLVFSLQVKGLVPILAHPERYSYYYNNKDRYHALHEAAYGKNERTIALYLIKNGLVDFVGTDIHNPRHISAINDYLTTKNAYSDMDALRGVIRNDIAFN